MTRDEQNLKASEYVLVTMETSERYEFEVEMGKEPALRDLVETWERNFAPLLTSVPEATPSPDTWPQIEHRIDAAEAASDSIKTVLSTAPWANFLPGIAKKQLHADRGDNIQCYLL